MHETPYGYCHCGCGERTNLAAQTDTRHGHVRGEPFRYLPGHHPRRRWVTHAVDEATGCWVWQGFKTHEGYGHMTVGGRKLRAHRWYYEQAKGSIPEGLTLDHLCRNPSCVNPDHLEPVPIAENCRRGSRAKLTMEQAREIRVSTASPREVAERYGVSVQTVSDIRCGRAWRESVTQEVEGRLSPGHNEKGTDGPD